jgi:hypothetical protein
MPSQSVTSKSTIAIGRSAIRTAGPRQVLKPMHMKTQEGKQPRFPFLRGKRER